MTLASLVDLNPDRGVADQEREEHRQSELCDGNIRVWSVAHNHTLRMPCALAHARKQDAIDRAVRGCERHSAR